MTTETLQNNREESHCVLLGSIQMIVGVMLLGASAIGLSVLPANIVTIPAAMGLGLFVNGVRTRVFQCPVAKLNNPA